MSEQEETVALSTEKSKKCLSDKPEKCHNEDRNNAKQKREEDSDSETDDESYTESEKIKHLKLWEMSNTEYLLKGWGEKAGCLRWMHLRSSIYWRSVDHTLNVTGILLSSLVSASSLLNTATHIISQDISMSIVGVISMCNVINQSLYTFYDCKNKASKHDIAARQFGNFNRYVSTKLSMSRLERGDPKEILDYVVRENERLYRESPDPHSSSVTLFKKKFIKNLQSKYFEIPDIVTDSFAINVYESNPLFETLKNMNNSITSQRSVDLLSKMISYKRKTLSGNINNMFDGSNKGEKYRISEDSPNPYNKPNLRIEIDSPKMVNKNTETSLRNQYRSSSIYDSSSLTPTTSFKKVRKSYKTKMINQIDEEELPPV